MSRLRDSRGRFRSAKSAVKVTRTGDSLAAMIARDLEVMEHGVEEALDEAGEEWRQIVRRTVWTGRAPSPESKIIVERPKKGRLVFGWRNFPGKPGAARARAELRLDIFRERLPKIIARHLKSRGRG